MYSGYIIISYWLLVAGWLDTCGFGLESFFWECVGNNFFKALEGVGKYSCSHLRTF